MTDAAKPGALAGIKVADFSHFVAGPICTLILSDLGADIIKIEKIDGGDDFRRIGPRFPPQETTPFIWANRNKRSIALDLQSEAGQAVARDIVAQADILVENYSTGVMARFGLDYETLAARHPKLIYCSISAYGRTGPLADRLGFDPITQAESGFMALNGEPAGVGVRTGPSIIDISTGMMASNAVLAALFARDRVGRGQYIECALFDQAVYMAGFHPLNYLMTGKEPQRMGNSSRDAVPVAVFETADGPIFIACANDRTWQRMAAQALARPDLAEHPHYARIADRNARYAELMPLLDEILRTQSREVWLARLREAGVPAGAVNKVSEAFDGPEIAARGMLTQVPHPTIGTVPNVALSFKLADTPLRAPVAAPLLGQHSRDVLTELGYATERADALVAEGVVKVTEG